MSDPLNEIEGVNIDSVLSALRVIVTKREFVRIVQLEERVRCQKVEIDRLMKVKRALAFTIPEIADQISVGCTVIDGYGREYVVKSFGRYGYTDTEGKEHLYGSGSTIAPSKPKEAS